MARRYESSDVRDELEHILAQPFLDDPLRRLLICLADQRLAGEYDIANRDGGVRERCCQRCTPRSCGPDPDGSTSRETRELLPAKQPDHLVYDKAATPTFPGLSNRRQTAQSFRTPARCAAVVNAERASSGPQLFSKTSKQILSASEYSSL